jgi:hypothetical protein
MDLCAYCNATSGRRTSTQLAAIFLLAAHTLFYRLSLAPGDGPNWIKDNAAKLCTFVAASAAAAISACAIICGLKISRRIRVGWLAGLLATVALNILSDLGGSVERHGQYNAIVFAVVVAFPLLLCFIFVVLSRCFCMSLKRSCILLLIIIFIASWVYELRVSKGRQEWPLGLWNERMVGTPGCPLSWVSDVPSFIDGFPARILNFWAGNLICPGPNEIAKWHEDGTLRFVDRCREGGGSVQLLPSNLTGLPIEQRGDQSIMQVCCSSSFAASLHEYW